MKRRAFLIEESTFKTQVLIVGDCTWDEARAYVQKKYDVDAGEEEEECEGLQTDFDKEPYRMIWLPRLKWSRHLASVLAHEVYHLCNGIATSRRLHTESSSDEAVAYLIEFYMREIAKKI